MSHSRYSTPPQIAEQLGCDVHLVLDWIKSGELVAVNLAARPGRRPRYKISAESLAEFLRQRETKPPAPRATRRKAIARKHYFAHLH